MVFLIIFGALALLVVILAASEIRKQSKMSPEEKVAYLQSIKDMQRANQFGPINSALICPHCQTKGAVRTKQVDRKKGVSGGKATAAVLTGGVSVLATGLSRKEKWTHALCEKCSSEWDF